MRLCEFHELDQALCIWLHQKQEAKAEVTCGLLAEQAMTFFEKLYPNSDKSFVASSGFIRHSWKASQHSQYGGAWQEGFSWQQQCCQLDQLFNCDETGLCFRQLPGQTLATADEMRVGSQKKRKDWVTFSACLSASGPIKMLLKWLKKPYLRGITMETLPVEYPNQKNSWILKPLQNDVGVHQHLSGVVSKFLHEAYVTVCWPEETKVTCEGSPPAGQLPGISQQRISDI